jgi:hypothetical protein
MELLQEEQSELVEEKPALSMLAGSMPAQDKLQRTCRPRKSWWRTSQRQTSQL